MHFRSPGLRKSTTSNQFLTRRPKNPGLRGLRKVSGNLQDRKLVKKIISV